MTPVELQALVTRVNALTDQLTATNTPPAT